MQRLPILVVAIAALLVAPFLTYVTLTPYDWANDDDSGEGSALGFLVFLVVAFGAMAAIGLVNWARTLPRSGRDEGLPLKAAGTALCYLALIGILQAVYGTGWASRRTDEPPSAETPPPLSFPLLTVPYPMPDHLLPGSTTVPDPLPPPESVVGEPG